MKSLLLIPALVLSAGLAHAEGDIAKGQKDANRCKSCHTVSSADEVFLKGGKTGPNLYGVIGRAPGSLEDFKYSKDMAALAGGDLVWTEEELTAFIADPSAWLKEKSGDSGAKSKMTFKMKNGENVAAWLASLAPPAN